MLNRIQLRGICGRVSTQKVGDSTLVDLSVMTDYVHKSRSGDPICETTWHHVRKFYSENDRIPPFEKGCVVEAEGRLRVQKYNSGVFTEVAAKRIECLGKWIQAGNRLPAEE